MVDDQQLVGNEYSVAATEDQSVSLGDSDYQENNHRICSKLKRPRAEFPWWCTHIGQKGIRQDYEVNDSVCYARSGFCRQATLKVGKRT
jgi:hypothetical protein